MLFAGLEIDSISFFLFLFSVVFGLAIFPGYLLIWPMLGVLPHTAGAIMYPAIAGWIVYVNLARAAIHAENNRKWERLFAVFVVLLCGNIAGCWWASR